MNYSRLLKSKDKLRQDLPALTGRRIKPAYRPASPGRIIEPISRKVILSTRNSPMNHCAY
jgi:hypothetical protein